MRKILFLIMTLSFQLLTADFLYATPSTQIWIPSTDIQAFKSVHLGIDNYFTIFTKGGYDFPTDIGPTAGVLPGLELGIDIFEPTDDPLSFNAKLGLPENKFIKTFPALAIGGCGFGTKKDVTDYNIFYGLVAKTFGQLGRFSFGYYTGNEKLLLSPDGKKDNRGILASWDRTMQEISDRLWVAIDYQSGKNIFGAFSFGFSWSFSDNVGLLVGYDIYNTDVKNTLTTQLDINF